ncbi:MAG TPA: hypothetical protein VL501_09005 [Pyrinomonadaceae bacterium]|nr:hypothetical protein [Pyrinomonadaceae bacterium]
MELLIPGLILVAVMAWASTRIKRNAAAAFDAETIDGAEFTIRKPDGWLSVAEPAGDRLFEAYSKEFGTNAEENIRRGTASLDVSNGNADDVVRELAAGGNELDDRREVIDDIHYRVIELEQEGEAVFRRSLKLAEKNGKVYTLTVTTLADATDEFRQGVETMIDSFVLK